MKMKLMDEGVDLKIKLKDKAVREFNDEETDGERRDVELKILMTEKGMELRVKMRYKARSSKE